MGALLIKNIKMKTLGIAFSILIGTVLLFLAIIYGFIFLNDYNLSTTQGEHTGVIVATEQSGWLFKTWDIYVKTSAMSTKEDVYCAYDPSVISALEDAQTTQEQVTISYSIPHWIEMRQCGASGSQNGIINAVNPVK